MDKDKSCKNRVTKHSTHPANRCLTFPRETARQHWGTKSRRNHFFSQFYWKDGFIPNKRKEKEFTRARVSGKFCFYSTQHRDKKKTNKTEGLQHTVDSSQTANRCARLTWEFGKIWKKREMARLENIHIEEQNQEQESKLFTVLCKKKWVYSWAYISL